MISVADYINTIERLAERTAYLAFDVYSFGPSMDDKDSNKERAAEAYAYLRKAREALQGIDDFTKPNGSLIAYTEDTRRALIVPGREDGY